MIRCATFMVGVLAVVAVGATGCALKPVESPPSPSADNCGDSFHNVSTADPKPDTDPEIDSLLTQETSDVRLLQINRRMYRALHALDDELRRERAIAACKQPSLGGSIIEAQSGASSPDAPGSGAALRSALAGAGGTRSGSAASSMTGGGGVGAASSTTGGGGVSAALSMTGGGGQMSGLRKSSGGAGGNGATAPKIVPGSDDDIVASRLRKAAEQETDPALRARLWKEYRDYRQGTAVAK
jgi:hypothetical protein